MLPARDTRQPRFIVSSKDFSGFGFAKMIIDAGYPCLLAYKLDEEITDPAELALYKESGEGVLQKASLEKVFQDRRKFKDAYWIWDQNNHNDMAQVLHDEGFKIWSGSALSGRMEHDRQFGIDIARKAGLAQPPESEFHTLEEGMLFLEGNEDKAYVFKPNVPSDAWETYVPDSDKDPAANRELCAYMEALPDTNAGGYVLQQRMRGVEANFEVWVRDGVPFFAFCDLECKKKLNDDFGPLVGGAQDIAFTVPIHGKGIQETSGKILALPEYRNYTGFLDMNVIVSEKENYFLEFCARVGYPAHPTLFTALARAPFPEILMEMIDGSEQDFYRHFKYGFAAGITLYTDKRREHMPIYVSEETEAAFFPYDLIRRGELTLLSGCGEDIEVGVITGHGYTLKSAAEEARVNMTKINFPNRSGRSDLDKDTYPSAPQGRYDALVAMHYV